MAKLTAKVLDVITSPTHPDFDRYGRELCLGAVKFKVLGSSTPEDYGLSADIAYPLHSNIKTLPLINEIVLVDTEFAPQTKPGLRQLEGNRYYWTTVVNIWNNPHQNANPDLKNTSPEYINLGGGFRDLPNINPTKIGHGDTVIEGRVGQLLHFSNTLDITSSWYSTGSHQQPLVVLRSGQKSSEQGIEHLTPDINNDQSSVWLANYHKLDLKPSKDLSTAKSYGNWDKPTKPDYYLGEQIIMNSGRIVLNSKSDSILLSSHKSVAIQATNVSIDGVDRLTMDAKKIYLGANASFKGSSEGGTPEPGVLGNQLGNVLEQLLLSLELMGNTFSKTEEFSLVTDIVFAGSILKSNIEGVRKLIPYFKSNKVYIE